MKTRLLALAALALAAGLSGCLTTGEQLTSSAEASLAADSRTVIVVVDGMVCNFCATNIDKTLAKLPGVTAVHVNLAGGVVALRATEKAPTDEAIRAAIKDAGFDPKGITRSTEDFSAAKARLKAEALKKLEQ